MKVITWTKNEDNDLLNNVKKYETKTEAFAATSNKHKRRTVGACAERWRVLKKDLPENFFEVLQVEIELPTVDKNEQSVNIDHNFDIIDEMTKIINEHGKKAVEIEVLNKKLSTQDGEIFDLNFQLSQVRNEKEKLEFQVEKFADLIEASMTEQAKYIEENRKLESQKELHEMKLKNLKYELEGSEAMVAFYKKENEKLKKEKEEYMNENNTIMNLFNKARKMFTGTDKEESSKFKMDRNGNLERIG